MTKQEVAELIKLLARLFSTFPSAVSDDNTELRSATYVDVLSKFPLEDVRDTINRVIRGDQSEHDGRFCPTCAQIAMWTRPAAEWRARMEERERRYEIMRKEGVLLDDHSSRDTWKRLEHKESTS